VEVRLPVCMLFLRDDVARQGYFRLQKGQVAFHYCFLRVTLWKRHHPVFALEALAHAKICVCYKLVRCINTETSNNKHTLWIGHFPGNREHWWHPQMRSLLKQRKTPEASYTSVSSSDPISSVSLEGSSNWEAYCWSIDSISSEELPSIPSPSN